MRDPLCDIAEEGTTFLWSHSGVRVFEDGVEVPRVQKVSFEGTSKGDQTATLYEILRDGSIVARLLQRPFKALYEKGFPDA